jgi:predicted transcriptional regulator
MILAHSRSTISFDTQYQPGGTGLVSRKWIGRCQKPQHDTSGMGRWSKLVFEGKANTRVAIICAYRVCKDTIRSAETKSAFSQQWHIINRKAKGKKEPYPRKQSIDDLTEELKLHTDMGDEIVLMLDSNEDITNENSSINQMVKNCGMIDIMQYLHPDIQPPETYQRGSKTIDAIFTTPHIAQATVRAGMEPYNNTIISDHRGLFIDVELDSILGICNRQTQNIPRIVTTKNHLGLITFKKELAKYIDQHNIIHRAQKLQEANSNPSSTKQQLQQTANAIDRDITRAIRAAENKCKGNYPDPYFPELIQSCLHLQYWRLWRTQYYTNRDMTQQRMKIESQLNFCTRKDNPMTIAIIKHMIKYCRKIITTNIKDAHQCRQEFLLERALFWTNGDNHKAAGKVKAIAHAEKTARTFSKLKRIFTPNNKSGLTSISIPTGDSSPPIQVTEDSEIIRHLTIRNKAHFSQAQGTPCTTPEVETILGKYGETTVENNTTTNTTSATRQLIHQLTRDRLPQISTHITEEEIKNGFSKWKEKTSTSPSGRHLGTYKALLAPLPSTETFQDPSESVLRIVTQLINLAFTDNILIDRWQNVTTTMLEKKPGNNSIDKLRVIHLIEADFNLPLGILWGRRLMQHAEQHNALGRNQWGARSGKTCIELVILKQLTYETSHHTRTNLTTFDNDAKACYDRIVMNYALQRSRQLGIPTTAAKTLGETLQKSKYTIKTSVLTSTTTYQSTETQSLHGPGQGSKAAPAIWTYVSSAIMQCLQLKHKGATFKNPSTLETT